MSRLGNMVRSRRNVGRVVALCVLFTAGGASADSGCPAPRLQTGYDITITATGFGGPVNTKMVFVSLGNFVSTSVGEPPSATSFVFDTREIVVSGRIDLHVSSPGWPSQKIQFEPPGELVTHSRTNGEIRVRVEPGARAAPRPDCRMA